MNACKVNAILYMFLQVVEMPECTEQDQAAAVGLVLRLSTMSSQHANLRYDMLAKILQTPNCIVGMNMLKVCMQN